MASLVRNLVSGMSAREKRLAMGMVVVMGILAIFMVVYFVGSAIDDLEEENMIRAQTLKFISIKKPEYLESKRLEASGRTLSRVKPTPLRTLVDGVANKIDAPDPDTKELSDQHHGNEWIVHAVEVSIRNMGLEKLTKFMEEVEANRRKFPIAITKLEIRKRKHTPDSFDVKMTISTYEINREETSATKQKNAKTNRKVDR